MKKNLQGIILSNSNLIDDTQINQDLTDTMILILPPKPHLLCGMTVSPFAKYGEIPLLPSLLCAKIFLSWHITACAKIGSGVKGCVNVGSGITG